ncbi:putative F-box/LRR-repeat protein [Cotonvirus japonicus]|uniref:F-box/LRR-repeat protein n=1 Tax=Cotonvirus japonicus TaxID=2811091 RepID=A0ABM7NTS0_9VIRU|nr:putative F-box/LRR-repeat protein [Cotonvirus japonicus]BCS83539.1 putative F-box/LRR-repeat protein [Cotonvirus japonicus]
MRIIDFPVEIVHEIFKYVSLCDIINLRSINHHYKNFTESMLSLIPVVCNNRISNLSTFVNVKKIDLQKCRQITDKSLSYLSNAEIINLSGCYKITDKGLRYLKNVREINLSSCHQITNKGLQYLRKIEFIDVTNCPNITVLGFTCFFNKPVVVHNQMNSNGLTIINELDIIVSKEENDHKFLKPKHTTLLINQNKFGDKKYDQKKFNLYEEKIEIDDLETNHHVSEQIKYEYINDISIQYANAKTIKKVNNIRCQLFDKIYNIPYQIRDNIFMKNYEDLLPNDLLFTKIEAVDRLSSDKYVKLFIKNLHEHKLDILIGGSMALYCVYRESNFIPGDMDIYIKNISSRKIMKIEDIIYKSFPILNLVVVRGPITITWYVQLVDESIKVIQLNVFNITSWAEIFVTYHTDLTCIGYEILTDKFVYLESRWDNILQKNKIHYFSNVLSLDITWSIVRACQKYKKRGFHCVSINDNCDDLNKFDRLISDLINTIYNIPSGHSSSPPTSIDGIPKNCLASILYNKYNGVENVVFTESAQFALDNFYPDIMFLSVYKINKINKFMRNNRNKINTNKINTDKKEFHELSLSQQKKILKKVKQFLSVKHFEKNRGIIFVKCPICELFTTFELYKNCNSYRSLIRELICDHLHYSKDDDFNYQWYPEIITD